MKLKEILKLITGILICQAAGFLGSLFTTPAIPTWYAALRKPFFNPPDGIFGPVWTGLYFLMGISFFMVWRRADHPGFKTALIFFFIQLVLNISWSIAFFGLRSPWLGFLDIVLLWIAIILTTWAFYKISKGAGLLFLPYLVWVSFAIVLNLSLCALNFWRT
jgi:translocator protein